MTTHYERLEVSPGADQDTVWRAYLSAVRHALTRDDGARDALVELDAAWETLRDPERRSAYDRSIGVTGPRDDLQHEREEVREEIMHLLTSLAETGRLPEPAQEAEHEPVPALPAADEGADDGGVDDEGRSDEGAADNGADDTAAPATTTSPHDESHRDALARNEPLPPSAPAAGPTVRAEGTAEPAPTPRRRHRRRRRPRSSARRKHPAVSHPRRMTVVVLWLLACAGVGSAVGWGVQQTLEPSAAFAQGACVALSPTEAFPAACDAPDAVAQVIAIVDSPTECDETEVGWIERPDGSYACLTALGSGNDQPG